MTPGDRISVPILEWLGAAWYFTPCFCGKASPPGWQSGLQCRQLGLQNGGGVRRETARSHGQQSAQRSESLLSILLLIWPPLVKAPLQIPSTGWLPVSSFVKRRGWSWLCQYGHT